MNIKPIMYDYVLETRIGLSWVGWTTITAPSARYINESVKRARNAIAYNSTNPALTISFHFAGRYVSHQKEPGIFMTPQFSDYKRRERATPSPAYDDGISYEEEDTNGNK